MKIRQLASDDFEVQLEKVALDGSVECCAPPPRWWDLDLAFGHAVTLNFDLLTPKSNQFISVPRRTSDKSLAKIHQQILEISRKQNYHMNHGRTDAYRRRRLKKSVAAEPAKTSNVQVSSILRSN